MIGHSTTSGVSKAMRFVYFARAGTDGPIKIGVTGRPDHRLHGLRKAFGPAIDYAAVVRGRGVDETTLHKIFAADRFVDEWFSPSVHLLAFIDMVAKLGEIPAPYRWEAPPEPKGAHRGPHKNARKHKRNSTETISRKYAEILPKRQAARAELVRMLAGAAA